MPLILAGRYLPVRLLGQGGFGAAFLALDRFTPTMRFCVVKQFQPTGNLSDQQLAIAQGLFEREATVLEQLGNKHEQIPDLYAFFPLIVDNARTGKPDQFFYLVQEFINGKNLEQELADKGQFSEAEARFVLEEMLKVLQFVHSKGSIHRDIKPSNIMRDQEGTLYLLDFGAVKQVTAGNVPGGGSTGIYSMGFAPPEQMTGNQVYPATDLYALAVTCLYLLTGKTADELYDPYHTAWNWRSFAPKVSDRFAQILDRLLLAAPKDRYQSATEVLAALNAPTTPPQPTSQGASTTLQPPKSSQPVQPTNPRAQVAPVATKSARKSFSIVELLSSAAFTGFEGSLIWLAATSIFPGAGISAGFAGMAIASIILAQWRRMIEHWDLLIIAGLSALPFWFFPALQNAPLITQLKPALILSSPLFQNAFFVIILIAGFVGLSLVAVTALFRLIYQVLSRLL